MACLVEMPIPVNQSLSKIRSQLMKGPTPPKMTAQTMQAPPEIRGNLQLAKGLPRKMRPFERQGAPAPSASRDVKALKAGGSTPAATPKAAMATKVSETGGSWNTKYRGRTPLLDEQLDALSAKISKLSPEEQTYWNEQINKQLNPKLASRNGTPYTPEKTNRSLTSQVRGWNFLVENGQPTELMDRVGVKRPAPKGMIPDVTSSGQRKWIAPDNGLKYSLRKGEWRQNRVSKADTDRRLSDIVNFRKERRESGRAWPAQFIPTRREDLPKTADAVLKGLSPDDKNKIVFNGLDATGNEGVKLRQYYNANPKEKEARLREIVQRWHDQGGLSGVSGKPIALPGMDPKPGEERSSVDHFWPLSTNRAQKPSAAEVRRVADNYKNFLIVEEGPNKERTNKQWDDWLNGRERESISAPRAQGRIRSQNRSSTPKPKKSEPYEVAVIPRAPSAKSLTEDQQKTVTEASKTVKSRLDSKVKEGIYKDDENSKRIIAARQEKLAPLMKMNANEQAALSLYGENNVKYFQQVNQLLRNGDFEGSTPEKKQMAEFIAGNLNKGLTKLPPAQVEKLERAVSGDFASGMTKLKVGDIIQDKGFGSYTNNGGPTLDQFIERDKPNAIIRVRNPKTAREVAPAMQYSKEGEHISLPGTRYKLAEIQPEGAWSRKTMGYIPAYIFEEVE